jgi:hypothetical protein
MKTSSSKKEDLVDKTCAGGKTFRKKIEQIAGEKSGTIINDAVKWFWRWHEWKDEKIL